MKTIKTKVYEYNELSEAAKVKARDWYLAGLDDWWDSTYEDAANIGLIITGFDLDRCKAATGKFKEDACFTADKILKDHGDTCDTYKIAKAFLANRDNIVDSAEKDENGDFVDVYAVDASLDEVEEQFLKDLLDEYADTLEKELDCIQSEENCAEAITANEYTFTEDGGRFG